MVISKVFFLLKYSCVKTLSFKYNKEFRRFRKIFRIFRLNLIIKEAIDNGIMSWFPQQSWGKNVKFNLKGGVISYRDILGLFCFNKILIICVNCNSSNNIFLCKVGLARLKVLFLCFICFKLLILKLGDIKVSCLV